MSRPSFKFLRKTVRLTIVLVFILSLAVALRMATFGTTNLAIGDNFFFGHADRWSAKVSINLLHVGVSIRTWAPAYAPHFGLSGPFFQHKVGEPIIFNYSESVDPDVSFHTELQWGIVNAWRAQRGTLTTQRNIWFNFGPLPLILLLASALALSAYRRVRHRRASRRIGRGCCAACGYDLRAHHPGDKCPECGTAVPASHLIPPPRQPKILP